MTRMHTRVLIGDLHDHIGKKVTVAGSVDVRRDHGKITFIDLRDRSGTLQTVVTPGTPEAHALIKESRPEWVLALTGEVKKRPEKMVNANIPTGDIEMEVSAVEVLGKAEELPFEHAAEINIDTLLDHRPLTLRRPRERAIFRVQHEILQAFREYLSGLGFTEFRAPALVGGDAEGGAGVFKFDYFSGHEAYLATSPQLYKQMMVGVFERVFTVAEVFRAEKHATSRHLNEYTSLDFEMGFIDGPEDVMKMETGLIRFITNRLKERCEKEFALIGAEFPMVGEGECFPTMTLEEAQELISKETGKDCRGEPDLEPEHERWLSEYAKDKFKCDFIFITNFPRAKRPFYAKDDPEHEGRTKCFDLLFRGLELISGNQREHEYHALVEKMKWKGLDPAKFEFYLSAFKYGMPPHGGIGMGLERLTARFLGLSNVKEATLFPRDINRIDNLLSKN